MIAHGSNRSPEQLQRKFADLPVAETSIPVTRAWLADHDVVYSAHVTQYGAIAANLRSTPGTTVEIYVTWLSEPQLNRMHETELGGENYAYGRLSGIDLKIEAGPAALLDEAYQMERWGADAEALARHENLRGDLEQAARLLSLLKS